MVHRVSVPAAVERIPLGLAFADGRRDTACLARIDAIIRQERRGGSLDRVAARYALSDFLDPPALLGE